MVLDVCQAITSDGKIIIGHGFSSGAWIVTIESTLCLPDIVPDGAVNVSDLLAVIGAWGQCAGPCPPRCAADIAPVNESSVGDCNVNVTDLLAVIGAWGNCPEPTGGCCISGSCSQTTESACLAAGGVYLGNSSSCTPTACVNNDACANAVDITNKINGAAVIGDNSTATPPFGGGDTELPVGSPSCHWIPQPQAAYASVWYKFTAPPSGLVTISLCNSTAAPLVDTIVAVYSGRCGSLVEYACDEDGCSGDYPFFSVVSAAGLTPGTTYFVAVMCAGGWTGSAPGPFVLNITSP